MNFQSERRGKVLKLPLEIKPRNEKITVSIKDPEELFVENYHTYKGESEWFETYRIT